MNVFYLLRHIPFVSRVNTAMLTRDMMSEFCPSVRLSVYHAPVLYGNGLMCRHTFFRCGSPVIQVFTTLNIFFAKFRQGHPLLGR